MISYPGDILRRFGRYEAVEDLGKIERAHMWRAWDPFLERFVRVAELRGLDSAELHRTLPRLDYALQSWLSNGDTEAVLDFSPGGSGEAAFLVLRMADSDDAVRNRPTPTNEPEVLPDSPAPAGRWERISARLGLLFPRSRGKE